MVEEPDPSGIEQQLEQSMTGPDGQTDGVFRRFSMDTNVAREITDEELQAYRENLLGAMDTAYVSMQGDRDEQPLVHGREQEFSIPDRFLELFSEYRDELDILTRQRDEDLIDTKNQYAETETSAAAKQFVETFDGVDIDPDVEIGTQTGLPLRRERSLVVQERDQVYRHMEKLGRQLRQYAQQRRQEELKNLENKHRRLEELHDDLQTIDNPADNQEQLDAIHEAVADLIDDDALEQDFDATRQYEQLEDTIDHQKSQTDALLEKNRFDELEHISTLQEDLDSFDPSMVDEDGYEDVTDPYLDSLLEYAVEVAKQDIYHQTFPAPQQHVVYETDHIRDVLALDPFDADTELTAQTSSDETAFRIMTYGLNAVEMDQLLFYDIEGTQKNQKDGGLLSRWRGQLPIEENDDGHQLSPDFAEELSSLRGYDAAITTVKMNFLGEKGIENGHTINPETIDVFRVGPFFYDGMETPPETTRLAEKYENPQQQAPKEYLEAQVSDYLGDHPDGFVFGIERETVEQYQRFDDPSTYQTPRVESEVFYVADDDSIADYLPSRIDTSEETVRINTAVHDEAVPFPGGPSS